MGGPRAIVLVGLMGAGKTAAGKALAARLRWPFVDSDAALEAALGQTAGEFHARADAEALHALEARHLLDALAGSPESVIAAAASVVDEPACRRALRSPDVLVAWLRADPAVLVERFTRDGHRPWYGAEPAAFLAEQLARRRRRFAALRPAVVVDTDALGPQAVAERVLEALAAGRPR